MSAVSLSRASSGTLTVIRPFLVSSVQSSISSLISFVQDKPHEILISDVTEEIVAVPGPGVVIEGNKRLAEDSIQQ